MRRFAGACRFVYNEALALQAARHERRERKLGSRNPPKRLYVRLLMYSAVGITRLQAGRGGCQVSFVRNQVTAGPRERPDLDQPVSWRFLSLTVPPPTVSSR